MAVEVNIPFYVPVQDEEKARMKILHLRLFFEMIKIIPAKYAELGEEIVVRRGN